MRYRTYKNTDLTVSEVGFGLWTVSTGWWGNFTEAEAIVSRLRGTGVVPAPMTRADGDGLIAAAAAICVWGRIAGQRHPVLDHLAQALAAVPPTSVPLAQLA